MPRPVDPRPERVVVAWDLPVRLFHWTLMGLVASAWISTRFAEEIGDAGLVWHRANGLAILTLLVWRLLWGMTGSSTARFSSFLRPPSEALGYARDLAAGRTRRYLGHNPLGAWMVLALIAALLAQAGFGLFAVDDSDLTGGPLNLLVSEQANKLATRWHGRIFHYVLLPLLAIHIAANVTYGLVKKEPLITAMVTGTKPMAPYEDAAETEITPNAGLRASACLAIAAAIVLGGLAAAGGRLL